jgi:hypothetical protein
MGSRDPDSRPREELVCDGKPGPAFADLLYRTVKAIARHYPCPPGSKAWGPSELEGLAHDFLTRKKGDRRLISLVTSSVDERSFAKLLEKAMRNFIADQARVSDLGKVVVRIKQVLRDNAPGHFVRVPGGLWGIPGHPTAPTTVPERELVRAMAGVQVVVPAWESETRDPPLADGASFVRLIEAVLAAAGGAMAPIDLAHVLTKRLNHVHHPLTLEPIEGDVTPQQLQVDMDPAVEAITNLRVTEFFDSMDDRERQILARRHLPSREKAKYVGLGHAQVSTMQKRLALRLRALVADDDHGGRCVDGVFDRCDDWLREQTPAEGPTLETPSRARKEEEPE